MFRFFAVASPLLFPDDPLAPPAAPGPNAGRPIVCGFCECALAHDGGVLRRSDRAGALVDVEQALTAERREHESTRARLAEADAQLAAAQSRLAELTQPPAAPPARTRRWPDPD